MKAGTALLAALVAALSGSISTATDATVRPVTFHRVPNGGLQPEAVVDKRGVLHLIYFAGEPSSGNLYYVRSTNDGATFTTPIRVNSLEASAMATGTIRGGQLAIGRDGRAHVVWNGSMAAVPQGSDASDRQLRAPMLYARSTVDGSAFAPQRNLARRSYAIDGGGTIAADTAGNVYAAWHALPTGDGPGEDRRHVWIARSTDDGASFSEEQPAWREPTGACGCCGMKLFVGPSDRVYLLFRSATAVVHRDIYLLESTDTGRSFRGALVQPWEIGACPMTSMSLTASASRVLGAWETAGQVYFGEVDARAPRIPSPIPAPGADRTRKHPRLAINDRGDAILVWTEGIAWSRGGRLAWQVFDAAGRPIGAQGSRAGVPAWSFATPIVAPNGGFSILY
jgi:hypothetical protein